MDPTGMAMTSVSFVNSRRVCSALKTARPSAHIEINAVSILLEWKYLPKSLRLSLFVTIYSDLGSINSQTTVQSSGNGSRNMCRSVIIVFKLRESTEFASSSPPFSARTKTQLALSNGSSSRCFRLVVGPTIWLMFSEKGVLLPHCLSVLSVEKDIFIQRSRHAKSLSDKMWTELPSEQKEPIKSTNSEKSAGHPIIQTHFNLLSSSELTSLFDIEASRGLVDAARGPAVSTFAAARTELASKRFSANDTRMSSGCNL
mmetsp:Transcript_77297/g.122043  ORF Transcript_77297/g.122043 Transcript_77297/m.122043 type:complete len:258 (-) Transcript_77297:281-1054(-)